MTERKSNGNNERGGRRGNAVAAEEQQVPCGNDRKKSKSDNERGGRRGTAGSLRE
ncbi:MAG: hypothetical protein ABI147_09015 [Acidobacteriaceae bacterium]